MKTLLWPQILNRIHQWVNVDPAGSVCSASTDQQGSFVSVDSSEPQIHVGAAAVFRVRPHDDVPIGSVTLEQTEMILKAGHLTNNHKQNNTVIVPGLHSCWPLLGVKGPPALTCILVLVLCCISSVFTHLILWRSQREIMAFSLHHVSSKSDGSKKLFRSDFINKANTCFLYASLRDEATGSKNFLDCGP